MKDYIYSRKAYRIKNAIQELYEYDYNPKCDDKAKSGYAEGYIPFSIYDDMVSSVVEKFGISSVFAISKLTQVSDSGLIGQLTINSEKIIDAMNAYAEYSELLSDVASYEFLNHGSYYEMRLFFKKEYKSSEFIFHKILLDTYNIFLSISESNTNLNDFYLEIGIKSSTIDERLFENNYGKIIQPAKPFYYAKVDKKYMDVPVFQPSIELIPGISNVLKKQAENIKSTTYASRLENLLFFSEQPSRVNIDIAADILGFSRSQLQRRLTSEGFKFKEIKNGVLQQRALFLASTQKKTLKEIAGILGYSNPSALSRSFKAWSGMSFEQFVAHSDHPIK